MPGSCPELFMRALSLVLGLGLLVACGPGFHEIQKQDTIEGYEQFLVESPNDPNATLAKIRLEELYLEKARAEKTLESYDLYLSKYPAESGAVHTAAALEERETFLYDEALALNTAEGWNKYLEEYPKGDKKRKQEARRRIKMMEHRDSVEIGPCEMEPVNLAEDPDGPLDGFMWTAEVTYKGEGAIETLNMELQHLGSDGAPIEIDKWPLVAPSAPGNMPIEEEWKVPVASGETRLFWFSDMAPEAPGWAKKCKLVPVGIKLVGEDGRE
jgi:hypothetical protein